MENNSEYGLSSNQENGKVPSATTWWQRRTNMEKKLTICSAIAVLIGLIFFVVIILQVAVRGNTCLTPGCIQAANDILEHIDPAVNPCSDFYEFACGNFLDNVNLGGASSKSVSSFMDERIEEQLETILEDPVELGDMKSIILAKNFYHSCLNESAIEIKGLRIIKESLRQMGGWPVVEGSQWKERDFDWKHAIYRLRELGYNYGYLIGVEVVKDEYNQGHRILKVYNPNYAVSYYTKNDEDLLLYFQFMTNISVLFGADRHRATNGLRDVIDFQKYLFPENEEDDGEDEQRYSVTELQYKFKDIPWHEYLNKIIHPAPNLTSDEIIVVSSPKYLERLQETLRNPPRRSMANYLSWMVALEYSHYLTKDLRDEYVRFHQAINKNFETPNRPKTCTQITQSRFYLPLQAAYVRKYFSNEVRENAAAVVRGVKKQFEDVVRNLGWMDGETRVRAMERIATSVDFVGYPNDLLDHQKIEDRYHEVRIYEDKFFASLLNLDYFAIALHFRKLRERDINDSILERSSVTEAKIYYSPGDNAVTIPGGILQGSYYDVERPYYLNFGALGSTYGHSIFHMVFAGKTGKYDTKYYDFMAPNTWVKFNEKLQCIQNQYRTYALPEIQSSLNVSRTRNEDLADLAGLKLAYQAYKEWVRNNGEEDLLPGIDYTPNQLFWISSAIRLCATNSPEKLRRMVETGIYSPERFRVLGPLHNLPEFASDFSCPSNSHMSTKRNCDLW